MNCYAGGELVTNSKVPFQSGKHRVEEVRAKFFLSFTWLLEDFPSRLNVTFQPHPEGVALTIEQLASPTPPAGVFYGYAPARLSFQSQFWDYAISRLRCVLEDGHADVEIPEDDKDDEVNLAIEISASPLAAFSALTDFTELRKWEGMNLKNGTIEKKVGGRYSFGWESEHEGDHGDGPRQIEEYIEGRKLTYSWFGETPSTVEWDLSETAGGRTLVTFKHAKFEINPLVVWEYKLGWSSSLFALKWYLERSEPHGAWIQRVEPHG